MRRSTPQLRGFTLIELVIVVAVIGVITGLAYTTLSRARPRQVVANTMAELQTIVHGARQQALARGHDVVVMVFPTFVTPAGTSNPAGGVGRIIVMEDRDGVLLSAAAANNLDAYDPAKPSVPEPITQDFTVFDLPPGLSLVTAPGKPLAAPLDNLAAPQSCSFCQGQVGRGALRFDSRGRASFYDQVGPPLDAGTGQLLAFAAAAGGAPIRYLYVTANTGAVMAFHLAD